MIPIKELLNKIKWSKTEEPDNYCIFYLDEGKLTKREYSEIKRIDGSFMVIGEEETYIPLHRVREVRNKERAVWKR